MATKAVKNTKNTEVQVAKDYSDKKKNSKQFFTGVRKAASGRPIFYFRKTGDYIKGLLAGQSQRDLQHYTNRTYIIKVWSARQDGEDLEIAEDQVEEIIAYRDLRRIIERCELMKSIVKIVLAGKVRTAGGHFVYVWEVWKDEGTFEEREVKQEPKPKRKKVKHG